MSETITVQTSIGLIPALEAAAARAKVLNTDVLVRYHDIDVIVFSPQSEGYDSDVIAKTPASRVQYDRDVMV